MKLHYLMTATAVSAFFVASAFAQSMQNGMQSTHDNMSGNQAMQSQTSMQPNPNMRQGTITSSQASPARMRPARNTVVRLAQQKLNAHGYQAGPADGVWGPKTRAALMKFQKANDLMPTGVLDQKTVAALDIRGQHMAGSKAGGMEHNGNAGSSMMRQSG